MKTKYFLTILLAALAVSYSLGQARPRDEQKENPVLQELSTVAPGSVETFQAATAALDSDNFAEAERLYKEVLAKAPDFDPALRRLGYVYASTGRKKEALDLSARALAHNRSIDNLTGRASILITSSDPNIRPPNADLREALQLSREAWQKSGQTDEQSGSILAEMLLETDQVSEFETFSRQYKSAFPESPAADYYHAIALANSGDFDAAEETIDRLKQNGIPDDSVAPLLTAISQARSESYFGFGNYVRYIRYAFYLAALWAIGLVAIFFTGQYLSSKTLRAIETSDPNDLAGTEHASLRKVYRKVIAAAGIYYYFSQPFVIFLVIAATIGLILGFLWIGAIPVKFLLIVVFVGAAAIFYMIKALFVRNKPEDPGRVLTEAEAPGLWKLARDVAAAVQTRPVDEIRLTHTADLAVYERGRLREKVSDTASRVLIVGAAILNDFDQNAFRAVIAHEYGHFSNRDTAGGDIAYRVNADIIRVAEGMQNSGTATFYNLGFQFLRLYHFLFRRVAHGASRLQEVMADRVAAHNYGAAAFKEGLAHVVRREIAFRHQAEKEINAALGANRAIQNLYEMKLEEGTVRSDIETEYSNAISRDSTYDDTHPSPKDRFRYVEGVNSGPVVQLEGSAWDLFADREGMIAEMHGVIEKLVRPGSSANQGILGLE